MTATAADRTARLLLSLIPEAVVKSQDDPAELADRVAYAGELTRQAQAAPNETVRKGFTMTSQAVLRARPRAVVAREHDALIAKARRLGTTSPEAERLERQAGQLLEDEPPAPRRGAQTPVTKGTSFPVVKGGLPVVVYDAAGQPGVIDPAKIVQKAAKGTGTAALMPVFDPSGKLVGVCEADAITPVTTDPANITKASMGKEPRRTVRSTGRR